MYGYALLESQEGGMVESESFNATPPLSIISIFFLNAVGNRGCRWYRPHPFHTASVHDDMAVRDRPPTSQGSASCFLRYMRAVSSAWANTLAGSLIMSPGFGSNVLVLSLVRPLTLL